MRILSLLFSCSGIRLCSELSTGVVCQRRCSRCSWICSYASCCVAQPVSIPLESGPLHWPDMAVLSLVGAGSAWLIPPCLMRLSVAVTASALCSCAVGGAAAHAACGDCGRGAHRCGVCRRAQQLHQLGESSHTCSETWQQSTARQVATSTGRAANVTVSASPAEGSRSQTGDCITFAFAVVAFSCKLNILVHTERCTANPLELSERGGHLAGPDED